MATHRRESGRREPASFPRREPAAPIPEAYLGTTRAPRLVLGLQPVRAAIRAHGPLLGAVMLEHEENPRLGSLARFARDQRIERVESVGRSVLDRLAGGTQHQGVAAWAPELSLLEFEPLLADPLLLGVVLDRVQDPQNFGAVLRSAVGLGASCVIWGEHSSAPLGPGTLRAAAGAAEFVRLCRVNSLPGALQSAQSAGVTVVGLDAQAEVPLSKVELTGPTLIVIGSEHEGMTPAVRKGCSSFARLVEPGAVESLNASVAAALALYEAKRQRV